METKLFKVNIFDVDIGDGPIGQLPFADAIERAWGHPFEERVRNVNLKDRRLDHLERDQECLLLNFITFDFPGPGRVRQPTPAAPIDLAGDEFFAHETAMLYDPEENLAFIEAMRGGVGPGAITDYLESFAGRAAYRLVPRLDQGASARARRQQQFRKLVMRVAVGPVGAVDHDLGIGAIEAFGEGFGARFVDVEIKVGPERTRSLLPDSIRGFLPHALQAHEEGRVTTLKLEGREHDDDPPELIDLLQHREKRERKLPVDDRHRKVIHEVRWDALKEIHRDFLRDVAQV